MREGFYFFENFKTTADTLPDDLRLKFYDALSNYAIYGIESDDVVIRALITAFKPTLDKVETRGGERAGAGRPAKIKENQTDNLNNIEIKNNQSFSKEIKNNQKNQNYSKEIKVNQKIQSFNKQETRNKKQENITISGNEFPDMVVKSPAFDLTAINRVLKKYSLPEIQKLTDERKTKLKARVDDSGGFDEFLGRMEAALAESSFLRGDNSNGWRADFDFFLQKSSWLKVVEGSYRDKGGRYSKNAEDDAKWQRLFEGE